MCDNLVKRLRYCSEEQNGCGMCALSSDCVLRVGLLTQAADAIESLMHTVEILRGAKINLVRCCECIYHDDESQYHYCRKWGRNCPNDSDFFCKWGKRKDGGQDKAPAGPYDLLYEEGGANTT